MPPSGRGLCPPGPGAVGYPFLGDGMCNLARRPGGGQSHDGGFEVGKQEYNGWRVYYRKLMPEDVPSDKHGWRPRKMNAMGGDATRMRKAYMTASADELEARAVAAAKAAAAVAAATQRERGSHTLKQIKEITT